VLYAVPHRRQKPPYTVNIRQAAVSTKSASTAHRRGPAMSRRTVQASQMMPAQIAVNISTSPTEPSNPSHRRATCRMAGKMTLPHSRFMAVRSVRRAK